MSRPRIRAIVLVASSFFLLVPAASFGAAPERSVYSQISSDQPDFVATPPPELRAFWGGMKREWFAGDWLKSDTVPSYCRQYAKDHPDALDDIMKDRIGDSEAKEMIYSMVVLKLDGEKTMSALKSYDSKGTEQQKIMAKDFIADIEEITRAEAFPLGDQYPDNHLPVTNAPPELREFWKGIDKQWIDTWAKTGLLNDYCRKYAQAHPEGSPVKFIMEDLVAHPSDVRKLVYTRLLLVMDREQIRSALTQYSTRGTAREKFIADDFLMLLGRGDGPKKK